MRTGSELAGLAVVSATEGERLGRIQDVTFDKASGRITGFLVDTGGLFGKPRFLPALLVRSVGTDAAIVEGGTVLEEAGPAAGSVTAKSLDGRPVLNDAGAVVGKVADVEVDTQTLTVPALLLSGGLIGNVLHRKPRLPFEMVKAIGQDSLLVPNAYDPKAEAPQTPSP